MMRMTAPMAALTSRTSGLEGYTQPAKYELSTNAVPMKIHSNNRGPISS